jgi:hypothetical protein
VLRERASSASTFALGAPDAALFDALAVFLENTLALYREWGWV